MTGLPNRVLLADRLKQAMLQAQRRSKKLVLVYLDLDGFKEVNDNYGHDVGDQLLIKIASRMRHVLRDCDTIARIGGDEFIAILHDLCLEDGDTILLTRLLEATAKPVQIAGRTLQVSCSIGITSFPQADKIDSDQLLRQADQAMYEAKLAGKNRYTLFKTGFKGN